MDSRRWEDTLEKVDTLLPLGEGWDLLDGLVADAERNRLRLEKHWLDSPPVGRVRRPVIIAGAYRTGTTFLHRLLSRKFGLTTLYGWNSTIPTGESTHKLITDSQAGINALYEMQPELKEMHQEGALLPAECVRAMAMTGITGLWPAIAPCSTYREFLMEVNAVEAYNFYDKCLRTLHPEGDWLLKSPMHSLFLEDIAEVWPDALIIRVYRPVSESVSSAIRFFAHLRALSQPNEIESHIMNIATWIEPYLVEHNRRVDDSPLEVIDISSFQLRTQPEVVAYRVGRRLSAYVHSH